MNILLRLYVEALSGTPLTPEKVQEIVGYTLLRAGIVDGRALIKDRFETLYDFLTLIGDNATRTQFIENLRNYLATDSDGNQIKQMMENGFYRFEIGQSEAP
jgi:hypothetical protein